MTEKADLCTRLKNLGYAKGNQVKLYGDIFDLLGDPVVVTDTLVLLDATERKSGQATRIRIPLPVVKMAHV